MEGAFVAIVGLMVIAAVIRMLGREHRKNIETYQSSNIAELQRQIDKLKRELKALKREIEELKHSRNGD